MARPGIGDAGRASGRPHSTNRRSEGAQAGCVDEVRMSEVDGNAQPRFDKFRYLVE